MAAARALAAAAACWPLLAGAWSDEGHMLVASIARAELETAEVALLDGYVQLLYHPRLQTGTHADMVAAAPWMSAMGGTFGATLPWHYVYAAQDLRKYSTFNISETPLTTSMDPTKYRPTEPAEQFNDILYALQKAIEGIFRPAAGLTPQNLFFGQALNLHILLHLFGDLHQPLHAVSTVTNAFPYGDVYGHLLKIRTTATANLKPITTLHQLVDTAAGNYSTVTTPPSKNDVASMQASAARIHASWARESMPVASDGCKCATAGPDACAKYLRIWADQGRDRASELYVNLNRQYVLASRDLPLTDEYLQYVRQLADRQLALAGYRLADCLKAAAKVLPQPPPPLGREGDCGADGDGGGVGGDSAPTSTLAVGMLLGVASAAWLLGLSAGLWVARAPEGLWMRRESDDPREVEMPGRGPSRSRLTAVS